MNKLELDMVCQNSVVPYHSNHCQELSDLSQLVENTIGAKRNQKKPKKWNSGGKAYLPDKIVNTNKV